jgi:hypothetical protein
MSPTYWGPYVWIFLHTLAARISEEGYHNLQSSIYNIVERILTLLPCPECSADALSFFKTIPKNSLTTKRSFCNSLYLLHNRVNAKLRKPLFNSTQLSGYEYIHLGNAYSNFAKVFNTTSTRIMADNMQRRLFLRQLEGWLSTNRSSFMYIIKPITNPVIDTIKDWSQPNDTKHVEFVDISKNILIEPPIEEHPIEPIIDEIPPPPIEPSIDYIPPPIEDHPIEPSIDIGMTTCDVINNTLVIPLDVSPPPIIVEKKRGRKKKEIPIK